MIITIDGPAGTGKSTIAKRVAALLGFAFFDTGAMYRAVAWFFLQKKIGIEDEHKIDTALKEFRYEIREHEGHKRYVVNNNDITEAIRTPEVTAMASGVAALPIVRQALVKVQRAFAHNKNSVFEGRDMGSVVFPEAEVRIFLTATPEIRAERRYKEWVSKQGSSAQTLTREQVLKDMIERDERDSTRACSPLKKAEGAKEIDTSYLTIDQVITVILDYVHEHTKK